MVSMPTLVPLSLISSSDKNSKYSSSCIVCLYYFLSLALHYLDTTVFLMREAYHRVDFTANNHYANYGFRSSFLSSLTKPKMPSIQVILGSCGLLLACSCWRRKAF